MEALSACCGVLDSAVAGGRGTSALFKLAVCDPNKRCDVALVRRRQVGRLCKYVKFMAQIDGELENRGVVTKPRETAKRRGEDMMSDAGSRCVGW